MSSVQEFVGLYRQAIHESADTRTEPWPLVRNPLYPVGISFVYVAFCWNVRKITSSCPAYNIRPLLVAYNAIMVALSSYIAFEFFYTAYLSGYSLFCEPVNYSVEPLPLRMASVCWVYYASKYVELLETFMFALRKKYSQITFLHVYHHASMIFVMWIVVKYYGGGQGFLFGGMNSFVHTVMYAYYGLAAIGPQMQKYLWWKKYITVLQLIQFVIMFSFCLHNLVVGCDDARGMYRVLLAYAVSQLILFLNFYAHAYVFKRSMQNGGEKVEHAKQN